MALVLVILALLPGIALVGPLMVAVAFDADWVMRTSLGFDVVSVILGVTAWATVRLWGSGGAGSSLVTAVSAGLVLFGVLFGAVSAVRLYGAEDQS